MSRTHSVHRMRETSLQAYGEIPELGEMQRKVFDVIIEHHMRGDHPTDREISRELGFSDPNKVRPRRFELMKASLIIEAERRKCTISDRNAITWKLSPNTEKSLVLGVKV